MVRRFLASPTFNNISISCQQCPVGRPNRNGAVQ
jgi:hypothetical protein